MANSDHNDAGQPKIRELTPEEQQAAPQEPLFGQPDPHAVQHAPEQQVPQHDESVPQQFQPEAPAVQQPPVQQAVETQYYVDQNGHHYYLDQNGQAVYVDQVQPVVHPEQAYVEPQIPQAAVQMEPQTPVQQVQQDFTAGPSQGLSPEPEVHASYAPPEDYGTVVEQPPAAQQGMHADTALHGGETIAVAKGSKMPMMLALVGAIGIGGGGAYVYKTQLSGSGSQSASVIPFIKASPGIAKVKPREPGGKVFQHRKKLVYDRIGGNDQERQESLRAGAERPARDTMNKARMARQKAQEHVKKAVVRKVAGGAPKSVRTFVVLPDGRVIKPGQQAAAPVKTMPSVPKRIVKQPVVPRRIARAGEKRVGNTGLWNKRRGTTGSNLPGSAPRRLGDAVPAVSANGKFRYEPRRIASSDATQIPAAPAARLQATGSSIGPGDFILQISASRSEEAALAKFASMKQQHSTILGSYTSDIQRADLGSKGIYYRLRIGPMNSRSAAIDVCQQLKEAGQDCLIRQK